MYKLFIRFSLIAATLGLSGCTSADTPSGPVANEVPLPPSGVYDVAQVDVRPLPIHRVAPVYPISLRRTRMHGEAQMLVTVTREGRVTDAVVIRATHPQFGQAARTAIMQWRFHPATIQGQSVACRVSLPMSFSLNGPGND